MPSSADAALLKRFQDVGDTRSLLEYLERTGNERDRYEAALRVLNPVFNSLHHGEHPEFSALDPAQLRAMEPEIRVIATCMADSGKADLNSSGARLLKLLRQSP